MRTGLLIASLLVLAPALAACGDDDSGSAEVATGASVTTFCGTYQKLLDSLGDADPQALGDDEDARKAYIVKLKDAVDELRDVGTPDGIPQSARDGFESSIQQIKGLPANPTEDDLRDITDVGGQDAKDQAAFGVYLKQTCPKIFAS